MFSSMNTSVAIIEPVGGHGGMDYYDYGLCYGLSRNNYNTYLYTSDKTKIRFTNYVNTIFSFKNVWQSKNKIIRLYFFLRGYIKSFKDCKRRGTSIIHFQFFDLGYLNFIVILISSFFSFKKTLTLHDISSFREHDVDFLKRFILNQFEHIIVHNEFSKNELIKDCHFGLNISVVPHGNYLPFLTPTSQSVNTTHSSEKLEILFFGQIKSVKGIDVLLKSVSHLKTKDIEFHITIAGRPWHDDKEKYDNLIKNLHISDYVTTHFRFIPDEEVSSFFEKCDVVVLPYKKIYQSGVLLLSMSYRKPVLCSNLPAFTEIIKDGENGYIFETGNPISLADKLNFIIEHKSDLYFIEKNAFTMLEEQFSWLKIADATIKIYNS